MDLHGLVSLCLSTSEEKKLSKEYPICLYIMQKPRNEPNNIYSDGYVRFVFSILLLSFYQIRSWGYAKYATVLHCKQGKKPLCLEMHAVMKMADLTAFCQTKWMFMDLMILSNFSQIFLKQNQLDYVV